MPTVLLLCVAGLEINYYLFIICFIINRAVVCVDENRFLGHENESISGIFLYPPEASGGYFGLAFPTPPPRVERFLASTL